MGKELFHNAIKEKFPPNSRASRNYFPLNYFMIIFHTKIIKLSLLPNQFDDESKANQQDKFLSSPQDLVN